MWCWCWLFTGTSARTVARTYTWCPCVAWVSSQNGGYVLRGVPKKRSKKKQYRLLWPSFKSCSISPVLFYSFGCHKNPLNFKRRWKELPSFYRGVPKSVKTGGKYCCDHFYKLQSAYTIYIKLVRKWSFIDRIRRCLMGNSIVLKQDYHGFRSHQNCGQLYFCFYFFLSW